MSQARCRILVTPVNMEKLIENQSKRSAKLQGRQKLGMKSIRMTGERLPFKRSAVGNIIPHIPTIIHGTRNFTFNDTRAKHLKPTNDMKHIYFDKKGFISRNFILTVGEST